MHDIAEFLGGRDPFSGLGEEDLEALAARTEVEFFPAGTTIVPQGALSQGRIRVIRRGSVELVDHGRPVDLPGEGEMFGHPSVLSGLPAKLEARAKEDTLGYSLAAEDVIPLLGRPSSLRYLTRSLLARGLHDTRDELVPPSPEVAQQTASALIRKPPVISTAETNLREAARLMDTNDASCVLVELGHGAYGIVTDSDLRSKAIAGRLTPDDPVSAAMSTPVYSVSEDQTGADVMMAMIDHDIRHVPVLSDRSEALGVIVAIDLVAAEICWMSLGSHGRREPVPSSDVDSGMAWRDVPESDPLSSEASRRLASTRTSEYMHGLAAHVADCVRVIGWRLDPHGVTASGTFSASSIEDWRRAIERWLERPSDNRVLIATSILLDGRIVYGAKSGLDVKRLALAAKPPTGFRQDIVVESSGEQKGTFDIKSGGLLPIVDLARYAALKGGVR